MLHFLNLRELDSSRDTETGVGNDYVDMIGLRKYFFHRFPATLLGADIAGYMNNLLGTFRSVSAEFKNTPATLCKEHGCCFSYTGTTTGDYKRFHNHICGAPSRSTRAMISTASSIIGSVCVAMSVVRRRHSPSTQAGAITGLT